MTDQIKQVDGAHDCQAILDLLHDSFAYMEGRIDPPSSLHQLTASKIAKFATDHRILVVEHRGAPIACLFVEEKPHATYLGKLAVATDHCENGHARALITHAAKTSEHQVLELETRIELVENHAIFDAMGFKKIGETAHDGYQNATSVTMQKRLSAQQISLDQRHISRDR